MLVTEPCGWVSGRVCAQDLRLPSNPTRSRHRTRARHAPRPLRRPQANKLEAKSASPPLHSAAHFPALPVQLLVPHSPCDAAVARKPTWAQEVTLWEEVGAPAR